MFRDLLNEFEVLAKVYDRENLEKVADATLQNAEALLGEQDFEGIEDVAGGQGSNLGRNLLLLAALAAASGAGGYASAGKMKPLKNLHGQPKPFDFQGMKPKTAPFKKPALGQRSEALRYPQGGNLAGGGSVVDDPRLWREQLFRSLS